MCVPDAYIYQGYFIELIEPNYSQNINCDM